MECFHPLVYSILHLFLFFLSLCSISCMALSPASIADQAPDELALLAFKSAIDRDPLGRLAEWNQSLHFCRWPGVTCGGRHHPDRVRFLDLGSMNLGGLIPPCLSNLTFLRRLSLHENQFYGRIPLELGHLSQLQHLNLSFNSLEGDIPVTLSRCSHLQSISLKNNNLQGSIPFGLGNCSELQIISLADNMLVGEIPSELATLPNLRALNLDTNQLTGGIPPSLGNLSSLYGLFLWGNRLTGGIPTSFGNHPSSLIWIQLGKNALTGSIPPSLGNLSFLQELGLQHNSLSGGIPPSLGKLHTLNYLYLCHNKLSGLIPLSIYNLSAIYELELCDNKLHGTLPKDMGYTLPRLQILLMYDNRLHGSLPVSLANASRLEHIEMGNNSFSGTIPRNLADLQSLSFLGLYMNHLQAREATDWSFLATITNGSLRVLDLTTNLLGGVLPNFVTNNSTSLTWLEISDNKISGVIPSWIWNLRSLETIMLYDNLLTGSIPPDIGNLQRLHVIDLHENQLSKKIPFEIGNLTQLNSLLMKGNNLTGSIPISLGNCRQLEQLDLSHNHLKGLIPKAVLSISSLSISLDLSHNSLMGALPSEVGSMINLREFRVTNNKLSGEIPSALGHCQILEFLYLDDNFFHGKIPESLSNLKGIQHVDLSRNNLSGPVPEFLEGLRALNFLNLSFNNFEGRVPEDGVFRNASEISILENIKICGGISQLHLPPCSIQTSGAKHRTFLIKLILPLAVVVLCLVLVAFCIATRYWFCKSSHNSLVAPVVKDHHLMNVSYQELLKATNGFSPSNLVGEGSFSSVYKGVLGNEQNVVAVKVLNLQQRGASKNFIAECEAFKNIRHRNIVRILTSCSSIDFNGNEFKALVFEYMSNGSLDRWLHPEENDHHELRNMSLIQRLNIAKDVATAIDYLHNHCHMSVVHCDLKPSNILLDNEMVARVGDFGLARLLSETCSTLPHDKTISSILKGSIGYMAPEYGMANKVSTQGDVYSYGILLLEIFTGKRPIDDIFKEGLCLRQYNQSSCHRDQRRPSSPRCPVFVAESKLLPPRLASSFFRSLPCKVTKLEEDANWLIGNHGLVTPDQHHKVKADKYTTITRFDGHVNSPKTPIFDHEAANSLEHSFGDSITYGYGSPDDMFLKDLNPCLTPPCFSKSKTKDVQWDDEGMRIQSLSTF